MAATRTALQNTGQVVEWKRARQSRRDAGEGTIRPTGAPKIGRPVDFRVIGKQPLNWYGEKPGCRSRRWMSMAAMRAAASPGGLRGG